MRNSPNVVVPVGSENFRLGVTFSQFKRYLNILHNASLAPTVGADIGGVESTGVGGVATTPRCNRIRDRRLRAALAQSDCDDRCGQLNPQDDDAPDDGLGPSFEVPSSPPHYRNSVVNRKPPSKHSSGSTPLFPSALSMAPGDSVRFANDASGDPVYFIRGNGPRFPDDKVIV